MIKRKNINGSITVVGAFVLLLFASLETIALTTNYVFIEKSRNADASETAAVSIGVYDAFHSYDQNPQDQNSTDFNIANDVGNLYLSHSFGAAGVIRKEGASYRVGFVAPYRTVVSNIIPAFHGVQVVQDSAKVVLGSSRTNVPSSNSQNPPMDIVLAIDYAKGYGRSRNANSLNNDVIKQYLLHRYHGKPNLNGEHVSIVPFTNRVYDPKYGCLSNIVLTNQSSHGFQDLHVNDWYNSRMNGNNPFGGYNQSLARGYLSSHYPNDIAKQTSLMQEFSNNFNLFRSLSMGGGSNVSELPLKTSDVDFAETFNKLETLDPSQKSKYGTNVISTISPRMSVLAAFNSCYLASNHLEPYLGIANQTDLNNAISSLPQSWSDGVSVQIEGMLRGAQILLHPELSGHNRRKLLVVFTPGGGTHSTGTALNNFFIANQFCKRIKDKVESRTDIDDFSFVMADTSTRQGGLEVGSCMRSQVGQNSVAAVDSWQSLRTLIDGNSNNLASSTSVSIVTPKLVPRV
ncbi:hypothetical protein ACWX0P_23620 [Vibrio mediterranei]